MNFIKDTKRQRVYVADTLERKVNVYNMKVLPGTKEVVLKRIKSLSTTSKFFKSNSIKMH